MRRVEIRSDHLRTVQEILSQHLPDGVRVWVFGSRVRGAARKWSDLDLALESAGPIEETTLVSLSNAFEDSDLSLRVDLVDLAQVSEPFRRIVEGQRVPLPKCARPDSDTAPERSLPASPGVRPAQREDVSSVGRGPT